MNILLKVIPYNLQKVHNKILLVVLFYCKITSTIITIIIKLLHFLN
jgi:hypothetical protein